MKIALSTTALALAMALSSCGGSETADNDVVVENDMNAMASDPSNPFGVSEMKLHDAMMAAVGVNVGDTWVKKMIEYHRGAVEMSRILLQQVVTGHVADMARQTIDKQGKEIEVLQKFAASGNPDPANAQPYADAEKQMHDAMMAAKGSDVSDTFVRKMLEHHKGAVTLSDVALAGEVTGAIRSQIEKTKAEQQKEIEHIEGMLSGAAASSGTPAAPAAQSPTPTQKPSPAKPTSAKPDPAPAKPKPAEPKTTEPKAAEPDCAPEHREAGHC